MNSQPPVALISHIQAFCLDDGPGIRTTVFMKGCPLRCSWCFNPECFSFSQETSLRQERCLGVDVCGICRNVCPEKCLYATASGTIRIDRALCGNCGLCADHCPTMALSTVGRDMPLEEVKKAIVRNRDFYLHSGGGVTLGGGEPLARPAFAATLAGLVKSHGIHLAVETCGYFDMDDAAVRHTLEQTDLLHFDIKHLDRGKHKAFTGVDNIRIMDNLRVLPRDFPDLPIVAHCAIIPGFNDSEAAVRRMGQFAKSIPTVCDFRLIPYSPLGAPKYQYLGKEFLMGYALPPSPERMRVLERCLEATFRT